MRGGFLKMPLGDEAQRQCDDREAADSAAFLLVMTAEKTQEYGCQISAVEKGDPKPDCYDLIESMVKQGRLGRKTGKGFYDYSK